MISQLLENTYCLLLGLPALTAFSKFTAPGHFGHWIEERAEDMWGKNKQNQPVLLHTLSSSSKLGGGQGL